MENTMVINNVGDLVAEVWKNDVTLSKSIVKKFNLDNLKKERVTYIENDDDTVTFSRNNVNVKIDNKGHKYEMPPFTNNVRCLLKNAQNGGKSCNIMLTGPMGTGKTEFVYEMANEMGYKVYQINGSENLTPFDFFGTMAVKVDEKTNQNYTYFDKGVLYKAFIEGTEVDSDGNQILYNEDGTVNTDGSGVPKVIGKPAIFFLDEFASVLSEVFLGVFNRAMEIPRENGASRTIEIVGDNGRVVKSHPSMVMFFSGNTVGTGTNGKYQMAYTAQNNKMDESTLNRMTSAFQFGYSLNAEKNIALSALGDDLEVERLLQLRDNLRMMYRNEKIERLFSTRTLVQICNVAKIYRNEKMKDWLLQAIKTTVFNSLPENDKNAWNETIRMIWGVDLMMEENINNKFYFYL